MEKELHKNKTINISFSFSLLALSKNSFQPNFIETKFTLTINWRRCRVVLVTAWSKDFMFLPIPITALIHCLSSLHTECDCKTTVIGWIFTVCLLYTYTVQSEFNFPIVEWMAGWPLLSFMLLRAECLGSQITGTHCSFSSEEYILCFDSSYQRAIQLFLYNFHEVFTYSYLALHMIILNWLNCQNSKG